MPKAKKTEQSKVELAILALHDFIAVAKSQQKVSNKLVDNFLRGK